MDKFLSQMTEIFTTPKYLEEFLDGIWETTYSTVVSTAVAFLLGLVLAVLLVVGDKDGVRPLPTPIMKALNIVINILRSVPFLILMLFVLDLSLVLVGTKIGTKAAIPPLIVAAAPFIAEAAQAMGCSPFQIVWKVMLPECRPALISSFTTSFITILSYGAMAGAIGGGGLGKTAINYGLYKFNGAVMLVATTLIVILVQSAQAIGGHLAQRSDKRLR